MSTAQEFQDLATELLTEFDERAGAQKVILITKGERAYDPSEGDYVTQPSTETPITGVATSYSNGLIASGAVNAGDIKFVATNAVEITTDQSVRMDRKTYTIVSVMPKAYTGMDLVISYEVQLRG